MKDRWTYLYRAVDSRGQTIDFLLSAKPAENAEASAGTRSIDRAVSASRRGTTPKRFNNERSLGHRWCGTGAIRRIG